MASILLLPLLLLFPILSHAATFNVINNCPYTVWAAASPGGGQQLNPGQSWAFSAPGGTTGARVWGRTGCSFGPNNQGHCQTGDCGGALYCSGYGTPPSTLAEYALAQFANNDYYDISLIEGFNIPMDFAPTTSSCHDVRCSANNVPQCPDSYRNPNDPFTFSCPTGTNYRVTFCP